MGCASLRPGHRDLLGDHPPACSPSADGVLMVQDKLGGSSARISGLGL